jgi:hypothetical protein
MNAKTKTSAWIPAAGNSAPAAEGTRTPDAGLTAQTPLAAAAGTKSPLAKWLLLTAGLCAAIVIVKAALLFGEICGILKSVYDSSSI